MADTVSCTGETLSFSPSTNPTLTDDSVSGTGKYLAKEHVAGGNAAAASAASCPIEERGIPEKGRPPHRSVQPCSPRRMRKRKNVSRHVARERVA